MSKIEISAWKKFPLGKLFHIEKGTRLTKSNMKAGDINFIGASHSIMVLLQKLAISSICILQILLLSVTMGLSAKHFIRHKPHGI